MIIIILSFIVAGIFLVAIVDKIKHKDKWGIIFSSLAFLGSLVFGIFCFYLNPREFPSAKYEISSKITTREIDTYEGEHHFSHIEKDTLYIVRRKDI